MPTTDAASAENGTGGTRRRLLGAGLAGSVLAAFGAQRASASGGGGGTSTPTTTDARQSASNATTADSSTSTPSSTTLPPGPPTATDTELLAFLLTVEMAASVVYAGAQDVDGLDPATLELYAVLQEHHLAYATSIAGRIGKAAVNEANGSVVAEYEEALQGADAPMAGHALELALIASHLDAIGTLEGIDASELLAAIAVVEGEHVAALAALAGLDPDSDYDAYVTRHRRPDHPRRLPDLSLNGSAVDHLADDTLPILTNGTNRRRFIQASALTAAGAAVLAACSTKDNPTQRIGTVPSTTTLPPAPVNDVTLLRTSSSLEYLLIYGVRPRCRAAAVRCRPRRDRRQDAGGSRGRRRHVRRADDRSRWRRVRMRQRADVRALRQAGAGRDPRQHGGSGRARHPRREPGRAALHGPGRRHHGVAERAGAHRGRHAAVLRGDLQRHRRARRRASRSASPRLAEARCGVR